jgi:hypothetical protein
MVKQLKQKNDAMAENRTRINCLEGNYANHYTTIAHVYGTTAYTCHS